MKKLFVALAAIAMSATFAAKADDCNNKQCNQPQTCNQPCDTACARPCDSPRFCPFDGLNLTEAQKQKFKELRAQKQQAKQAKKEAKRDAKAERKADRKADRKEAKKAQLAEIKSILTPEQYLLFLENNFVNGDGQRVINHAGKPGGPAPRHRR